MHGKLTTKYTMDKQRQPTGEYGWMAKNPGKKPRVMRNGTYLHLVGCTWITRETDVQCVGIAQWHKQLNACET